MRLGPTNPTVRQLEYIVAVADQGSFQNAAAACHVTQPGLSAQVRQLEEVLGVRVFERNRSGVLVTPAGERVLVRARRILSEVKDLVDTARQLGRPLVGPLRMGVIPTVAPYVLPAVLPAVRLAFPELQLVLREQQTEPLVSLLEQGSLDVLLLALEAVGGRTNSPGRSTKPERIAMLPLYEDDFVLATAPNHPLARRKRVRDADLEGQRLLLLEDGHCLRDQALAVCAMVHVDEAADLRATSLGTLTQMVASDLGITLLPRMSLPVEAAARAQIATVGFAKPRPHRTIGLAWRTASSRASELTALAKVLQKAWPTPPIVR